MKLGKMVFLPREDREVLRDAVRAMATAWADIPLQHDSECITRRYAEVVLRLAEMTWADVRAEATWGDGSYEL